MQNLRKALVGTDWVAFKAQKEWLARHEGTSDEAAGLLAFLDAAQDAAVEDGVLPEETVFPGPGGSKLYTVKVEETSRFWGEVTVEARSHAEAEMLANDAFVPRWEDSARVDCEFTILTENGVPVAQEEVLLREDAGPGNEVEGGPDVGP